MCAENEDVGVGTTKEISLVSLKFQRSDANKSQSQAGILAFAAICPGYSAFESTFDHKLQSVCWLYNNVIVVILNIIVRLLLQYLLLLSVITITLLVPNYYYYINTIQYKSVYPKSWYSKIRSNRTASMAPAAVMPFLPHVQLSERSHLSDQFPLVYLTFR